MKAFTNIFILVAVVFVFADILRCQVGIPENMPMQVLLEVRNLRHYTFFTVSFSFFENIFSPSFWVSIMKLAQSLHTLFIAKVKIQGFYT